MIQVEDFTHNKESKSSPCLARLVRTFNQTDSYRALHPNKKVFSQYYTVADGSVRGSRIDRSYHWGNVSILEAGYHSVAFSDHLAYIIQLSLPGLENIMSPTARPLFKTSPEVVLDKTFKSRLEGEMVGWQQVKDRGLAILPWWEIVVKHGNRRLAITRSKDFNKQKRYELNCLQMKQSYYTRELQAGKVDRLGVLNDIKARIGEWYEKGKQQSNTPV